MNERIARLRSRSCNAVPTLSIERAGLLTEFYRSGAAEKFSAPVARAMAFKYIMENKAVCINEGELIVGERGPGPMETPTFPEVCCHSLKDLDILDTREKISFKVSQETREYTREVLIPYWRDRSLRDKLFKTVDQEWIDAYAAGVFTEFMEQRAPGHTVGGETIFTKGINDLKNEISAAVAALDYYHDFEAVRRREQLEAMAVAADAIVIYAHRHAEYADECARRETDPGRKQELEEIARICRTVPANAPATFWEALQHYWFIHLGVITEFNTWDSFNPGRLDQHLYPFYRQDLQNGILTKEGTYELLQAFWIKFNNQPAPPKVGVTAEESNTYTDFCNINLGGIIPDGSDAVNELSYMLLDVIKEMRILQPSSNVQISKKSPDRFLKKALDIVKTGFGQPSIFNTDAIIQELTRQGKTIVDARKGGASGCVEAGAFGAEAYILSGYFNLVKILEITLHNGIDPATGKKIGLKTGDPTTFSSYSALFEAFARQVRHFIDIKIKGNIIIERLWAENLPAPFLSLFIDDCIKKGKDYNDGGARYNTTYIQIVGMGSITDCLASLKYNVFDKEIVSMKHMLSLLETNFENAEDIRNRLIHDTPKYGNDDDYADNILRDVFELVFTAVDGRPNSKGGHHRINLLPTTVHVYFGSVTGATPDGRKAKLPLSEGISPVQGADMHGPTAVIKSAAKIDHLRTGGTLLNLKFTPQFLADKEGITKLAHLIRAYFKMDGHHVQFNVVSADTLRAAQKNPEKYRNLIVRVAGYSDYFINLGEDLQNEIISRTEHISA